MLTNFGNCDLPMMEVEMVAAQIGGDEPTEHLKIDFLHPPLEGKSLIIGEWSFDSISELGDVKFNCVFLGVDEHTSDELIADNHELIHEIGVTLINSALEFAKNEGVENE